MCIRDRVYSPWLGRWTSPDPSGFSDGPDLYRYVHNNPTGLVDPDGRAAETPWDAMNVAMGAASLAGNIAAGNVGGALVDGLGLAVDCIATGVPGAPGGAASVIKGYRAAKIAKGVHKHHLLPRKFKNFFTKKNLNIEKWTMNIPDWKHTYKPDGVHTGPDNWNKVWEEWIEKNKGAKAKDVLGQLDKMVDDFGLRGYL